MILVTGASGYVGNNLVRHLVRAGKPVRAMVHNPQKAAVRLADLHDRIEIVPLGQACPAPYGRAARCALGLAVAQF
jgi:uncharacterized protein YbjT (DUF2867 family)